MLMLAQEALEIKKLREIRHVKAGGAVTAATAATTTKTSSGIDESTPKQTPARKPGGFNFGKKGIYSDTRPTCAENPPMQSILKDWIFPVFGDENFDQKKTERGRH